MTAPPEWKLSQHFGKENPQDVDDGDIISALKFDSAGDFLAAGDKAGRIHIFEKNTRVDAQQRITNDFKLFAEFVSHEREFDCLRSLDIEERINDIAWLRKCNNSLMLLTTNDKTVKLWRVHGKQVAQIATMRHSPGAGGGSGIRVPQIARRDTVITASLRRVYANAHAYHINSVSANSDGETFISTDDLRVNMWHLGCDSQSFNIVDIKPSNMEELTEVITSSVFHPSHCNVFAYSNSRGVVRLADMRKSALCDEHAQVFAEQEDPARRTFFSEIISSISDVTFSADGRYMLTRDYMSLKLWDVNMNSRPVKTYSVHEHLRGRLCELYENDCIFDKFRCSFSPDGRQLLTGTYGNQLLVFNRDTRACTPIEASKKPKPKPAAKKFGLRRSPSKKEEEPVDLEKKILHACWHPKDNLLCASACNNLYFFSQK